MTAHWFIAMWQTYSPRSMYAPYVFHVLLEEKILPIKKMMRLSAIQTLIIYFLESKIEIRNNLSQFLL